MILDVMVRDPDSGKLIFDVIRVCEFVKPGLLEKYISKFSEVGVVSFEIRMERGEINE